jgi:hypothetical protein
MTFADVTGFHFVLRKGIRFPVETLAGLNSLETVVSNYLSNNTHPLQPVSDTIPTRASISTILNQGERGGLIR